ncbi:MAG: hypothetical protein FWD77_09415 [Betaproteobacteria bacterium]|nr:hypothetical protein [Betaproteobacteria bacterium]
MTKILYRANPPESPEGPLEADYVDAATEREAVAALKAKGYTNILLYEFVGLASLNKDRDKLSPRLARMTARSDVELYEAPCWRTLIRMFLRLAAYSFWFPLSIALVFLLLEMWRTAAIVLAVLLLLVVYLFWQFGTLMNYVRLVESWSIGDWDSVLRLGRRLRASRAKAAQAALVPFDVEIRSAYAEIARAEQAAPECLQDILRNLMTWSNKVPVPGMYENHLALLHHKAGDYSGCIAMMRKAYETSPDGPMLLYDWALAEARLGDTATAARLMAGIDPESLPALAQPMYLWLKGMIALRENRNEEALFRLQAAVDSFLVFAKNPSSWSAFGLCAGACALAQARAGRIGDARTLVMRVLPILEAHGDRALMTMIRREVLGHNGQGHFPDQVYNPR